jgi:hypothetical protein
MPLYRCDAPTFYWVVAKQGTALERFPVQKTLLVPPSRISIIAAIRSTLCFLITLPRLATLFLVPAAVAVVVVIGVAVVRISEYAAEYAVTGIAVAVTAIASAIVVIITVAAIAPSAVAVAVTAIAAVRVASVAVPSSPVILGTRRRDESDAYEVKRRAVKPNFLR